MLGISEDMVVMNDDEVHLDEAKVNRKDSASFTCLRDCNWHMAQIAQSYRNIDFVVANKPGKNPNYEIELSEECVANVHYIYIYAFRRRFYPKRLPKENFTKEYRSLQWRF